MRPLFIWHRYIGLMIAPFILLMLITAFLLNHSEDLKLAAKHVSSKSILTWYGIKEAPVIKGFKVNGEWLYQAGSDLYFGKEKLKFEIRKLGAALLFKDIIFLIDDNSLLLVSLDGELIEKLDEVHGLPEGIVKIGIFEDLYIAVKGKKGIFKSDMNLLKWDPLSGGKILWASPRILPEDIRKNVLHNYRGRGPSYERFLLDLHSGRFMGKWGVFIMDTFAALFLLLSLFGICIWARGIKRKA